MQGGLVQRNPSIGHRKLRRRVTLTLPRPTHPSRVEPALGVAGEGIIEPGRGQRAGHDLDEAVELEARSRRSSGTARRSTAPAPQPAPSAASSCAGARQAGRNKAATGSCRRRAAWRVMIIRSVTSAVGVRSCTATDSASSISDGVEQHFEPNTFLGRFITSSLLFGELKSHFAVAVGIVAPVLAHLHEQEQMHAARRRSRRSPCAHPRRST